MARAIGISVSQIYRVREGKRGINQSFISGAIKTLPDCRLDDLFYLTFKESARRGFQKTKVRVTFVYIII